MNGLLLSVFLHLGHTLYSFNEERTFSLHNLISAWFSFIVIMGYVTVEMGIYQEVHGSLVVFPYMPYILEFFFFLIFIWPFRALRFSNFEVTDIPIGNQNFKQIILFLLVAYLVYFYVLVNVSIFTLNQSDFSAAYDSVHFEGKALYRYNAVEEKIVWICGSLYDWTSSIVFIYAIWGIVTNQNGLTLRFNIFCLAIVILIFFLDCISSGRRGGTFFFIIRLLFVILPLWSKFSNEIKSILIKIILLFIAVFAVYAVMMTISRFENSDSETPLTSVMRYLGESYPHLGNVYWGKVLFHPMGARLYPFIFSSEGAIAEKSLGDLHTFWGAITGVPILNYKTLYGDFYVDFGPEIPFLIIFIYSFILKMFIKKGKVSFAAYPVLYYYIIIATCAPLWFNMREWNGVKLLIAAIVVYFIVKRYCYSCKVENM